MTLAAALGAGTFALLAAQAASACPMCKELLLDPSQIKQNLSMAKGYAIAIGLMLGVPALLVGTIGALLLRAKRRARSGLAAVIGLMLLAGSGVADAQPTLQPFAEKVAAFVKQQYPDARVWLTDETMEFDYNARGYMIHYRAKNGQWQRAVEEKGPNQQGIVGFLSMQEGQQPRTADFTTDTEDRFYYRELRIIRYAEKADRTLYATLRYPEGTPSAFVQAFAVLMNEFEKTMESEQSAEAP